MTISAVRASPVERVYKWWRPPVLERLPAFAAPPQARRADTRISIVVVNHNYAPFLGAALDSALGQRGATVEVVAVDDGSTDESRALLAAYASRVRVVLQPNQGQVAAFNAGLEASEGDVVLFLDSDDLLDPQVAARVAGVFERHPAAVRVVFRLAIVDHTGLATGELIPPLDVPLPTGDVRQEVLRHADDLAWPPTSGNAFAAWALRRVMPLPGTADMTGADSWLHPTIPLLGDVIALDGIGGSYRVHGANHAFRHALDVKHSQRIISRSIPVHLRLRALAGELGYDCDGPHSVTLAAHRMVSLRLGGPGHPVPGDTRIRVLAEGVLAACGRRDAHVMRRLLYVGWFFAAAIAPRRLTRVLAESFFLPSRRNLYLRRLLRR